MKLTTRLAIVVTIVLATISIISGTQSILVNKNEKLATYVATLNNLNSQLTSTTDDPVSLALFTAENSPIPMSLVFIANNSAMSYLSEDAGSDLEFPVLKVYRTGLKKAIQIDDYLVRFYEINSNEYLAFFLSTETVNEELRRTYMPIITFNLLLVILGGLFVAFIFRRDSKLNSEAKAIQEFIGDASHELKTPLTIIRGYSEILMKDPDSVQKYAERINKESLRMTSLIDSLLKIVELDEVGEQETVTINLIEYLEAQIEDLLVIQPKRNVKLIGQPSKIDASFELVDTLISNVISNARTHTPETAPIQITVIGKQVIIEDGGSGLTTIPSKPFQRFDKSRSRDTGGSGLGMSLIQKSAKKLGAKLQFGKSELGGLKVEINF